MLRKKKEHLINKLESRNDLIDAEVRNSFQEVTTSMMKCAYRCDHYGLRDVLTNHNIAEATYPRHYQIET